MKRNERKQPNQTPNPPSPLSPPYPKEGDGGRGGRARGKSHHPIARHFFVENVAFVVKGAETT